MHLENRNWRIATGSSSFHPARRLWVRLPWGCWCEETLTVEADGLAGQIISQKGDNDVHGLGELRLIPPVSRLTFSPALRFVLIHLPRSFRYRNSLRSAWRQHWAQCLRAVSLMPIDSDVHGAKTVPRPRMYDHAVPRLLQPLRSAHWSILLVGPTTSTTIHW